MSYGSGLRPIWLSAVVALVVGCEAFVGELPDPLELTGDGGSDGTGGRSTGGRGEGGSGGRSEGGLTGGTGGASQSGGVSGDGGAGGASSDGGASSSGGGSVEPPDGGDGGDGSVDDGGTAGSGGAGTGGTGNGGAVGTGGAATGGSGGASGGTGGKGTGGQVTCTVDADGDGYISKACGGPDCDDSDEFVRPNQTGYFDEASKGGIYDYNCNNSIERDPALSGTPLQCGLLSGSCTQPEAFFDALPACGTSADWGTCKKVLVGLSCEKSVRTSVTMACR